MKRLAFYGRVSTDDNQNPEDSYVWQYSSAKAVAEREGGEIVAEYFDEAVSRSIPWNRRPLASQLLADAKLPDRAFDGVVVGELTRAFSEVQAQAIVKVLNNYGVDMFVPEFDGAINTTDTMQMMMLMIYGYKAADERSTIQRRVRTGQKALIEANRRVFMGGRPPFGYQLEDDGPHPNPKKAHDGKRLKKLVPNPATAPTLRRIFTMYVEGVSLGAIAQTLTDEGIPCPSASDPDRNSHRLGLAWTKSSLLAILGNANYLGTLVWNKQSKHEVPVDEDRPDLGNRTKQTWNAADEWVHAPAPTHQPLIDGALWDAAQRRLASGKAGHRAPRRTTQQRSYLLSGLLRCNRCGRRMQGQAHTSGRIDYRCRNSDVATTVDHPKNIYMTELPAVTGLDAWLAQLLDPDNIDNTCAMLLDHQADLDGAAEREAAKLRRTVKSANDDLEKYRRLLLDGAESKTVVAWISEAEDRKSAAERELRDHTRSRPRVTKATLLEGVLAAGGLPQLLQSAEPRERQRLYQALGVELRYDNVERTITARQDLSRLWGYERVEGGT